MNLYEISKEHRIYFDNIDAHIDEETGEVDPRFYERIEELEGSAQQKLESIGVIIKELQGDRAMVAGEIKQLKGRRDSFGTQIANLKRYATDSMKVLGIDKIKGALFTIWLQKNQDKVEVAYPDNLPMKYQKIAPVEPRLNDLKADIKSGLVPEQVIEKAGVTTIIGQKTVRYKT